ncbi:unnamed protein product [Brachionus calyciflorus]|uniref:Reverse transcriptase domain-containing protein n=1 Tax=Brachionus calyciflorus TaxID=104777 RepID=A0A813RT28_9BILA|nr:unnamed protein product [Brachionus calyciflorus]
MLKAGIILASYSPWSSPVCLINKPDGSKRFCIDYRQVNNITVQDPFPLPRIEDLLDKLGGATIFFYIDLNSGYWQIPMAKESMSITAFSTQKGHYEFRRLPFGLKNGPSFFSRVMASLFSDLETVIVYIDDIFVFSDSVNYHFKALERTSSV